MKRLAATLCLLLLLYGLIPEPGQGAAPPRRPRTGVATPTHTTPLSDNLQLLTAAERRPVRANEPGLVVKGNTLTVVTKLPFEVHGPEGADLYSWSVPAGWTTEESAAGDYLTVTAAPQGAGTVSLRTLTINLDAKTAAEKKVRKSYSLKLYVGKLTDPDVDPGPDPTPKSEDPFGGPPPAVTPGSGIRVLILFESMKSTTYPAATNTILYGKPMRDYLKAACMPDPSAGDGKAYRIWDKDVDTSAVTNPMWVRAMARPHPTMPWIVVGNGRTGFEGPLPKDTAAAIALCDKYRTAKGWR